MSVAVEAAAEQIHFPVFSANEKNINFELALFDPLEILTEGCRQRSSQTTDSDFGVVVGGGKTGMT